MDRSNFDRLLHRYITGQVSGEEKAKLEAWLDVVKTEHASELELSKEDEERIFQKIVSINSDLSEIRGLVPRKRTTWSGWPLRIAAALVVVALASYAAWYIGKQHNESVVIASVGPVKKTILPDGSLVWLKGNSKLVYYVKEEENTRYAELKGEALFEVARDAGHPFVINCGQTSLKVLGTSFHVKTNGDSLELTVLTGKVNVSAAAGKGDVVALPHEKVLYSSLSEMRKALTDSSEALAVTSGTEYNMQFSNAPLSAVVTQLQRKFDVVIRMAGSTAASCSITVDLTDQSLEESMTLITEVLDVEYGRDGQGITLSGAGCKDQ